MAGENIKKTDPEKRYRRVLSASTLTGDRVKNAAGEDLGKIDEIMIDSMQSSSSPGRIMNCQKLT